MSAATTLEDRVIALERAHFKCPAEVQVDESMRRARQAVERLGLYSSRWVWVPEPYYTWTLERRAAMLKAPTTAHLCKSLLLENKKVTDQTHDFFLHPRFVMVVLQYEAELSTDLLTSSIRRLRPVTERLDQSEFDWRVADPEDNDRITGYQFNSVTPLVSLELLFARSSFDYKIIWRQDRMIVHRKWDLLDTAMHQLGSNFFCFCFAGSERRGANHTEQRGCRVGLLLDGRRAVSSERLFQFFTHSNEFRSGSY